MTLGLPFGDKNIKTGFWEDQINTKEPIGGSIGEGRGSEGNTRKKLMCVGILVIILRGTGKNYPDLSHEELI